MGVAQHSNSNLQVTKILNLIRMELDLLGWNWILILRFNTTHCIIKKLDYFCIKTYVIIKCTNLNHDHTGTHYGLF
jgi:hypothetical protein